MSTEQERQRQQDDRALRTLIAPGSEVNRTLLERNSRSDRKVRFDAEGYLDLTDAYTRMLVREEMIRQRDRHHDLAFQNGTTATFVDGVLGTLTAGWINAGSTRGVYNREQEEERAYQNALGALRRIRDPQANRAGTGNATMGSEEQRRVNMAFGNRRSDGTYTYGGHDAANQLIAGGRIRLNNGTEYADAAAFVQAQPELAAALRADLTLRANDMDPYNSSRKDAVAALAALDDAERIARRRRGEVARAATGTMTTSVALTGRSATGSIAGSPLASNGGAEITVNDGPANGVNAGRT